MPKVRQSNHDPCGFTSRAKINLLKRFWGAGDKLMKKNVLILIISLLLLPGCTDSNLNIQNTGLKNSDKNSSYDTIPYNDKTATNTPPATQGVLNKSEAAANTLPATQGVVTEEIKKIDQPIQSLYKVARVIDGDTIELESGDHVRYIGIDTPETVDPRKTVQCFGKEASNKNKELVSGKMVRLEKDITDKDKYGRLLRYVYVDNIFVNLELVKQGYAYSYSYPPDIKHQDLFVKAQQEAKDKNLGLWGSCQAKVAAPTNTNTTNTNISNPSVPNTPEEKNCTIKGNINSKGEKIYHSPGCKSYNTTQIDEDKGEKWFCSEVEAIAAGWRKALNCQ
ncbi:hypothetical protein A3H09_02080 [Candidatus Falkowbacteria bacterium RIFCSPLOWO2_12_FULL_45_13]|uniref:TNase-like domain-containing protein n=1 Tax=Candidatus Falkowbacteria bacterium RIFCSPLOWO2_12_FULL_45_13 TaxID=1797991 RepID=A0A1F5SVC9_9BACT|nr:MAG: hypothetical protein A3H09_02080 [Candidatus Falkowbacteria bacterium RIFCSPLOWO2_12_FULL_45_13]